MEMPTHKLDAGSLRYLCTVEACEGIGLYGIYVERPRTWVAESVGCGILAVGGGLCLLAGSLYFAINMGKIFAIFLVAAMIGLLVFGVLFTLYEFYGWRRLPGRRFLWVDALNMWEVRGWSVEITSLLNLRSAELARVLSSEGGVVLCTPRRVEMTFGEGEIREVVVDDRDEATRLVMFLRAVIELRDHPQESVRLWARTHPGGLGALAHQLTFFGGDIDPTKLPRADDPPQPGQDNHRWRPPLHFDPRHPSIPLPPPSGHTGIVTSEAHEAFNQRGRIDLEPWETPDPEEG